MVNLNKKINGKAGCRTIKSGFNSQENLVDRAKYYLLKQGVRPCQIKSLEYVHAGMCDIVEEGYLKIVANIILKQMGMNTHSVLNRGSFGLYDVAVMNAKEMFYISSFFMDNDSIGCILSSVETGNPLLMFCPDIDWDAEYK